MEYRTFDPSHYGFPKALIPVLPVPGLRSIGADRNTTMRSLLNAPNARSYTRGRYALAAAYALCGAGTGTSVLVPAYHCRSMLDPAIRLGAGCVTYPLAADLSPDMAGLTEALVRCSGKVSALLATHFFGFTQGLASLLAWCQHHDITLIEDCSHCLFLPPVTGDIGLRGRYCVSSPYKFFALEDGGILWANGGAPLPDRASRFSAAQELKAMARAWQRASASSTLPNVDQAIHTLAPGLAEPTSVMEDRVESSGAPSSNYHVAEEQYAGLRFSRWMMCHSRLDHLLRRRRTNYLAWAECVRQLPYCRALYPTLQSKTVPYMFPLLIDHPDIHFLALKRLGMPIWRWDDMAESTCAVSTHFRTHLLHLPCHQELLPSQMQWMTSVLALVMNRLGGRA